MRPHTLASNTKLITTVLVGCGVGYLMIGLGGYLSFRKATAGNVLRNVDGFFLGQTGAKAIKFGYALVLLASVPTILLPLQKGAKDAYVALVPSAAIPISGGATPGKPRGTKSQTKKPTPAARRRRSLRRRRGRRARGGRASGAGRGAGFHDRRPDPFAVRSQRGLRLWPHGFHVLVPGGVHAALAGVPVGDGEPDRGAARGEWGG